MLRRLLARLLAPVHEWLVARMRKEHVVRGFRVVLDNHRPDIDSEQVIRRFGEALELVALHQPSRFAHMQRDVQLFWIVRQPTRGSYWPGCGMIVVELTFLARTDIGPEVVAATIIHEGMHARIDRLKLRDSSRNRAREERICHRAALDLGRALPPGQGAPVIAYASSALSLTDDEIAPEIDWALARQRQRDVDREAFGRWRRGAA